MKYTRITVNPRQMGGVPCIRGLRIPVATVVGMVADNMTEDDILKAKQFLNKYTGDFARAAINKYWELGDKFWMMYSRNL